MKFETLALRFTEWVGSPSSVLVHTLIFVAFFILIIIGYDTEKILLILTTGVSLEAIYLSIFIQMKLNHNTRVLNDVNDNVEDIQDVIEEFDEEDDLTEEV